MGCLARRMSGHRQAEAARVLDVLRYASSVQLPERWGKPPRTPSDAEPEPEVAAHGDGRVSPVDYLLADPDHAGEKRDQVEVLRGDPHQVAQVADSCGHRHRYTYAVLAWAPEDDPARDQVEEVLAEQALADAVGSQVEQCYARSDVLERRREVMES